VVIDSDTGNIAGQISQFVITSPYQTSVETDTSFEQGGIGGEKIGQLSVSELDFVLSVGAVKNLGRITITQSHTGQHIINITSDEGLVIGAGENYISFADGIIQEDITIYARENININPSGQLIINSGGDTQINSGGAIANIASGNIYEEQHSEFVVSSNGSIVMQAPHGLFEVDGDNLYLYAVGGAIVGNGTQIVNSSGTKTAIVKTSKGYRALYTNESPDVWFMDFCQGKKKRCFPKFWKTKWDIKPDLMFLEVTEKPYIVIPTGLKGIVQLWAKRKGMGGFRFSPKTEAEFKKNNAFWDKARIDKIKKRA
jgi:hypothetical protein